MVKQDTIIININLISWSLSILCQICTTCYRIYLITAFGFCRFRTLSETPRISPASLTKYSKSLFSHLFVNWANLTFYCANSSSKSKSSSDGFGSSLNTGGNTPGLNPNNGTSNCGTIKVNASCFTSIDLYIVATSGARSRSYLNNSVSNMVVKSLGNSYPS